jgi:hypothetical protein
MSRSSSFTTSPTPEGGGRILVSTWCWLDGEYRNCELLSCDPAAQTAQVIRLGTLCQCRVDYPNIQSVSLAYTDGTILQTYGAPIAEALAQVTN